MLNYQGLFYVIRMETLFFIWLEVVIGKDSLQHLSSPCLFLEFLIFEGKVDMFAVVLPLRQSLSVLNI